MLPDIQAENDRLHSSCFCLTTQILNLFQIKAHLSVNYSQSLEPVDRSFIYGKSKINFSLLAHPMPMPLHWVYTDWCKSEDNIAEYNKSFYASCNCEGITQPPRSISHSRLGCLAWLLLSTALLLLLKCSYVGRDVMQLKHIWEYHGTTL